MLNGQYANEVFNSIVMTSLYICSFIRFVIKMMFLLYFIQNSDFFQVPVS